MNKNFTISEILDAIKMFNQIKKKVNTNDNYKKKVIKDDNTDILIWDILFDMLLQVLTYFLIFLGIS